MRNDVILFLPESSLYRILYRHLPVKVEVFIPKGHLRFPHPVRPHWDLQSSLWPLGAPPPSEGPNGVGGHGARLVLPFCHAG